MTFFRRVVHTNYMTYGISNIRILKIICFAIYSFTNSLSNFFLYIFVFIHVKVVKEHVNVRFFKFDSHRMFYLYYGMVLKTKVWLIF